MARIKGQRASERVRKASERIRAKVIQAFHDHPGESFNGLARIVGVSRTCVCTILRSERLHTTRSKGGDDYIPPDEPPAARKPASSPTTHPPGTPGKLEVLIARREAGEELWHPLDCQEGERSPDESLRGDWHRRCCNCQARPTTRPRGLCSVCSRRLAELVASGETTWEKLNSEGRVRPVRKSGKQKGAGANE